MSNGQVLAVLSPVLSLVTLLPPQLRVKTCAIPRNAPPTPVPLQATASPYPSQKFPERVVSPWIHQFSTRRLMNSFILSFSKHTEFILQGRTEDTNVCGKALWGSARGGSVNPRLQSKGAPVRGAEGYDSGRPGSPEPGRGSGVGKVGSTAEGQAGTRGHSAWCQPGRKGRHSKMTVSATPR